MRENFKFSMVPNVPANAEFFYLKDSTITCKRIGKSEKVRYNYGEYSLSAAAIAAYKSLYGKDTSLCGPEYWLYDGKTLNEWRVENEQKKADKIVAEHVTVARSLLSIKKVIDFIENYPIVSLKNWGDTFYGYPEEVLEKMWNMVDNSKEEKLKKKICVLDDFGLQVHKFLIKKGVSPENIYFCISNEDESFLEIVKAVYSKLANSDRICSIFSLKNVFGDNNMFDLIIANPPFSRRAVSSKLFPLIPRICKQAAVLFPTSFASSLGNGDPNCRESWNHFIDKIEYVGPNVFENTAVDVSLYFCKHSEEDKMYVFSDFEKKLYPLDSVIKDKCLHAKEHILKEWLGDPKAKEGPQERKENRKWIQSRIENGEVFLNGSIFCKNYADGLVLRKVSGGVLIGFQGPKVVAEELKKEIYKGLAYLFSTNKRDVSGCHLVKIPIFCEKIFTEEEKEYLLRLGKGSKEYD